LKIGGQVQVQALNSRLYAASRVLFFFAGAAGDTVEPTAVVWARI
jgi:hypothetical protein